jgi:hypothetical protein
MSQVSSSEGSESAQKRYTRRWLGKRPPGQQHMLDLAFSAGCMFALCVWHGGYSIACMQGSRCYSTAISKHNVHLLMCVCCRCGVWVLVVTATSAGGVNSTWDTRGSGDTDTAPQVRGQCRWQVGPFFEQELVG